MKDLERDFKKDFPLLSSQDIRDFAFKKKVPRFTYSLRGKTGKTHAG